MRSIGLITSAYPLEDAVKQIRLHDSSVLIASSVEQPFAVMMTSCSDPG